MAQFVNMDLRLPPSSPESERAVIGCCLISPVECLPDCVAHLSSAHFYELRNRIIWESFCGLAPDKVNVISVMQSLKDAGKLDEIGGVLYLAQCQDEVPSTANLLVWIETLIEKKICRDIIKTCTNAITEAYSNGKAQDILDKTEQEILKIRPDQKQVKDIKDLVKDAINRIEARFLKGDSITGIGTGLIDLDRMSDGLHRGEMIVIAGFPSTGKTALAANIAVKAALNGVPTVFFSAEMRPVQLVVRAICSESRVNFHRVKESDFPAMMQATVKLAEAPLYIEQASQFSVSQIISIGRRLKQKYNIQLAAIDYIQLLSGTGDNREQEISSISKGIKAMAMELEIPVIALSQLNDEGKLRESRAIGQDADTVWKLENDGEWQPLVQPIKLNIIKCRDGATGQVKLTFLKEFTLFQNASKVED